MFFKPFITTPFTDLEYIMCPMYMLNRENPHCNKLQLKYIDCLEAYGPRGAIMKCSDIWYDLSECNAGQFQYKRFKAIQEQRKKLYKEGKLDQKFIENPPLEMYLHI